MFINLLRVIQVEGYLLSYLANTTSATPQHLLGALQVWKSAISKTRC